MTTKHMSRAERELDIMAFLHRNYLVNGQWVTTGEYARYAGMSVSPHLRGIFMKLIDEGMLTVQQEPYRATVMYTFALNYEKIEACYPHTKHEMLRRVGAWQEALL